MEKKKEVDVNEAYEDLKKLGEIVNEMLEVASKETTIKELGGYFQKNKNQWVRSSIEKKEYFDSAMNFLKSFELTPEIIKESNERIEDTSKSVEGIEMVSRKINLGIYLSAMIQTSYNQEFNNFIFEDVNAIYFGAFLKGQAEDPIKITTKTIEGWRNFEDAERCLLRVKMLKGDYNLCRAENCVAEITKYKGDNFGIQMENCTTKSRNEETLEMIKRQATRRTNNFELGG